MHTILIAVEANTDGLADALTQHVMETFNDDGSLSSCYRTSLLPNLDGEATAEDLEQRARVLRLAADYCTQAAKARRYRLEGKIVRARTYEKTCDALYAQLPEEFKW